MGLEDLSETWLIVDHLYIGESGVRTSGLRPHAQRVALSRFTISVPSIRLQHYAVNEEEWACNE